MTVVVVTHDPNIALYAERVVRFKDGRILSDEKNAVRKGVNRGESTAAASAPSVGDAS
jgi:ABC-type lipoprotein export system ATPase subunit